MYTVTMEVENKNSNNVGLYVPATKDFKKLPRTEKGIEKAIQELCKNLKYDWITDFNIVVYEGRVNYWNKVIPIARYDKNLTPISV